MKVINCIIVDDEPLAIALMKKHVGLIPELNLVTTCASAVDAFSALQEHEIDLLFLDIEMPIMTGKEFLETVKIRPAVILTTAYREYAVDSYEWNVIDYLLKPISFPRFLKAFQKFKQENVSPLTPTSSTKIDHIYVNANKKQVKILFHEVLYIESIKDYIRIHLNEGSIVTKEKISAFVKKLPSQFLRVHRSYVVNIDFISAFTANDVEIKNKEIPIGVSYKREVLKRLRP